MIFVYSILSFWLLWVFYLAVMNLKRVRDSKGLSLPQKVMGYPALWIGLVLDLFVNVFICTFIFFEIPKELLVTTRLQRHAKGPEGKRKKIALWFGEMLLNDFDPDGNHLD